MFSDKIEGLKAVVNLLDARGQEFANSLISQFNSKGSLSDKQFYWVDKLTQQVTSPQPKPACTKVDLSGVIALIKKAQKHLKHPAVVLRANGCDIRLSLAGSKARVPGSVNVCGLGGFNDRDWYGRVTDIGEFQPSAKYEAATVTAIAQALKVLSANPVAAAAEYAKLTGCCCFCGLTLTDAKSVSVGYGPVCASNWGLPYPTDKEVKAAKKKAA